VCIEGGESGYWVSPPEEAAHASIHHLKGFAHRILDHLGLEVDGEFGAQQGRGGVRGIVDLYHAGHTSLFSRKGECSGLTDLLFENCFRFLPRICPAA
jgi:hypothetical protein